MNTKLVWEGEISSISSNQFMNIFHEIHAQNQDFILLFTFREHIRNH